MQPVAAPPVDRVKERQRAAALARHYRDVEDLPIAEIARRLGRAPATVKAYLYDPTGEKARAVKARYRGLRRNCGVDTSPRNGKGDAHAYCWNCRRGEAAPRWTRERVRAAMRTWLELYGQPPTSYDWSRTTHARARGPQAVLRLERGHWPARATVSALYGSWPGREPTSSNTPDQPVERKARNRRTVDACRRVGSPELACRKILRSIRNLDVTTARSRRVRARAG